MDPSHIVVGALTLITVALLVWIEYRSRRSAAAQQRERAPAGVAGAQKEEGGL